MTSNLIAYSTFSPHDTGEALYEDRKSQFFGFAIHAESADEAIAFRHDVMKRIPSASHYVSAWALADGTEFFSDAKEPHGSAGLPVLNAIKGRNLKDTACVVARIFGGTLLWKGGLMRAYTKAASDALDSVPAARRVPCRLIRAETPYNLYEPLLSRLPDWNASVDSSDYAELVTLNLVVASEGSQNLIDSIRDFSNARISCFEGPEELRFLE